MTPTKIPTPLGPPASEHKPVGRAFHVPSAPVILTGVPGEEPAKHSNGPTACLALSGKSPLERSRFAVGKDPMASKGTSKVFSV